MASDNNSKIDIKLDYVLDTKSLIRQAMTNKGIEVTDDTTFRKYADLINNLKLEADQSDATATANDIVAGKIAYNNNNKVVGNLSEFTSISSEVVEVMDNTDTEIVTGTIKTDTRTLLSKNANINVDIPYDKIDSYNRALDLVNDILGENESEEEARQAYMLLNQVTNTPEDEYQGIGGSIDDVMNVLNQIKK